MQRAQKRDAVHQEKFYFRKNVLPVNLSHSYKFHEPRTPSDSGSASPPSGDESSKESSKSSGCDCGCGCGGASKKHNTMPNGVQVNSTALPNGHVENPTVEKVIETLTAGMTEKETRLRNCFPEVTLNTQPPANGMDDERMKVPVEEEYEEMTIEEVICGKVCHLFKVHSRGPDCRYAGRVPWFAGACARLSQFARCGFQEQAAAEKVSRTGSNEVKW
jgi:glutamate--cysteine ligase catalytic subunit